jgi:phage terminase large subunit-like protein
MRISEEVLNKCNTLEDLVELMVTDKNGKRLSFYDVGETKDFVKRYKYFKEWLGEEIPDMTLEQILYIMDNKEKVVDKVHKWMGFDRLLTALEFEQRKYEKKIIRLIIGRRCEF